MDCFSENKLARKKDTLVPKCFGFCTIARTHLEYHIYVEDDNLNLSHRSHSYNKDALQWMPRVEIVT